MGYPATVTRDDGQYTVTFPDVPGAVTFGKTREEALRRASEALLTVFDALMRDRREIPPPSTRRGHMVEIPALEAAKLRLYQTMRGQNVGKAELARRLRWHLPQVDRVLKIRHGSQLDQLQAAFAAVGKRLVIDVQDIHAPLAKARVSRRRPRTRVHAGVLAPALPRTGPVNHDASNRGAQRSPGARRATKKR
jgi:antitoxin HicB